VPVVPELSGLHPAEAFAAVRNIGLQPVLIGMPSAKFDGCSGYRVAGQEPPGGREVDAGTRVALALRFSTEAFGPMQRPPFAPHGTPAPDVVGLEIEQAIARVTYEGFIAVVVQPEQSAEDLAVSRQEPDPGAPVTEFREIALWLD
jgi:beta-lactam-binding protein with PASTA domain